MRTIRTCRVRTGGRCGQPAQMQGPGHSAKTRQVTYEVEIREIGYRTGPLCHRRRPHGRRRPAHRLFREHVPADAPASPATDIDAFWEKHRRQSAGGQRPDRVPQPGIRPPATGDRSPRRSFSAGTTSWPMPWATRPTLSARRTGFSIKDRVLARLPGPPVFVHRPDHPHRTRTVGAPAGRLDRGPIRRAAGCMVFSAPTAPRPCRSACCSRSPCSPAAGWPPTWDPHFAAGRTSSSETSGDRQCSKDP